MMNTLLNNSFHGRQMSSLASNSTNISMNSSSHGRNYVGWDSSSSSSLPSSSSYMPVHVKMNKDSSYHPYYPKSLQSESLLGMALYDYDSMSNDVGYNNGSYQNSMNGAAMITGNNGRSHANLLNNNMAPISHAIDEYKDMSLRDILELSDTVLAPDNNGLQQHDPLLCVPSIMQNQMMGEQQSSMSSTFAAQERQLRHQRHLLQQQQLQLQLLEQQRMQLNLMNMKQGNSVIDSYGDLNPLITNNMYDNTAGATGNIDESFVPSEDIYSNVPAPTPISSAATLRLDNSSHHSSKRSYSQLTMISDSSEEEYFQNDICFDVDVEDDFHEQDPNIERRFRPYQAGQWSEKYEELCQYRDKMGHCLVPHTYTENLALARWVKRQRYQYKLMFEGKSTTMTEERVKVLEDIGFVWDSQGAAWGDRLHELQLFKAEFRHCNVPSNYCENPRLATWIKCQRRQFKLYMENKPSNMTPMRINELEKLGFEWELRTYKKAKIELVD